MSTKDISKTEGVVDKRSKSISKDKPDELKPLTYSDTKLSKEQLRAKYKGIDNPNTLSTSICDL